ncbi:hypothetical protein BDR04DRAFT_1103615 [Suillus decipiens]|nr:hypothetical protein BDR04DRAFT_1103615 [Suillus decipiens]
MVNTPFRFGKEEKLKEANLTITSPSAEGYATYLRAVLATHGISPAFSVKPISFPQSQKDAIDVDNAADFTNHELTKKLDKMLACHRAIIDHHVLRTKGLD